MLTLFNLLAMVCIIISCRSSVTVTLEVDLFEKTLAQTTNPQLVDVRTLEEYSGEHLPGSIMIDVRETTFDSLILQLDKNRPVFVYCRSGKRSLDAAGILEKNNFKEVYNLEGGIIAWKEKDKAVK